MNPELVIGADFDGYFGIPIIKKIKKFLQGEIRNNKSIQQMVEDILAIG